MARATAVTTARMAARVTGCGGARGVRATTHSPSMHNRAWGLRQLCKGVGWMDRVSMGSTPMVTVGVPWRHGGQEGLGPVLMPSVWWHVEGDGAGGGAATGGCCGA